MIAKIHTVSYSYGKICALKNVSLTVNTGTICGFIGHNGAGKTTLIKLMMGLIVKQNGEITLPDSIGYVPQMINFAKWRTVRDTLILCARLSGVVNVNEAIDSVAGLLFIKPFLDKKVGELSGGMLQIVGIAQSIIHSPEIIIMDEPFSALDPENRAMVKKVLRTLGQNGTTILFSSHILSDIDDLASHIAIISQGEMLFEGTLCSFKERVNKDTPIIIELGKDSGTWQEISRLDPAILSLTKTGNKVLITIDTERYDDILSRVIVHMIETGNTIMSIEREKSDLETMVVNYTGKGK